MKPDYQKINSKLQRLIKHYDTRDPYLLARCMDICVFTEPLGSLRGYYTRSYRIKSIHINESLEPAARLVTCAHELGHSLFHPNVNTAFLTNCTSLRIKTYELEANYCARLLLLPELSQERQESHAPAPSPLYPISSIELETEPDVQFKRMVSYIRKLSEAGMESP